MTPTLFNVQIGHIGDDILSDLQAHLERVRWPEEIPEAVSLGVSTLWSRR